VRAIKLAWWGNENNQERKEYEPPRPCETIGASCSVILRSDNGSDSWYAEYICARLQYAPYGQGQSEKQNVVPGWIRKGRAGGDR
jgi:hypothetical protein